MPSSTHRALVREASAGSELALEPQTAGHRESSKILSIRSRRSSCATPSAAVATSVVGASGCGRASDVAAHVSIG